ncbi:MAG TPA: pyridoxal-dependent decarboxylase [Spirochaetota bacterium]|nr:pyridoxal-dependent decarboxylase [Spirochaetota bacterium]
MEQIRKLFIMPDSADKFHEFGNELLDLIHEFFTEKGGIHSSIILTDLAKIFSNIDIPDHPHLLKDVLYEIKNNVISHSVKVGNPYYIGHMTSAVPYFVILLEMIIAALNQNQVKIESAKASTFVEKELMSWMHRLIFKRSAKFYKTNIQNREVALGNITLDGTMANLTALLTARNLAFGPQGRFPGIREAGLVEAYRHYGYDRAVIIVSKRGHYSIDKVGRTIGIGNQNVIKIPVDSKNKIDILKLEKTCREIEEANAGGGPKTKIISIVGIAGTTETGNIDNLKELRKLADRYKTHFHVDAAWGGSLLLADDYRYLFTGIEKADSVTVDAHKLMYAPPSLGMVFFRNGTDPRAIQHYSNYIIRQDSVDLGRFSVEGSRPFAALKPWATLKIIGRDGFKLIFDHAFELTSVLRGLVEMHCNFEAMNQPELFIFNYRFVPKYVQEKLQKLMTRIQNEDFADEKNNLVKMGYLARVENINMALNDLNIEVHKAIREEDESFVSRTMIDSPYYFYQDCVVLRAITINPLTTPEILKEIIEQQNKLGQKIYKNFFHNRFERI